MVRGKPGAVGLAIVYATWLHALMWWFHTVRVIRLVLAPNDIHLVPGLRNLAIWTVVISWAAAIGLTTSWLGIIAIKGKLAAMYAILASSLGLAFLLAEFIVLSIRPIIGGIFIYAGAFPLIALVYYKLIDGKTFFLILAAISIAITVTAYRLLFPSGERRWKDVAALDHLRSRKRGGVFLAGSRMKGTMGAVPSMLLARDCKKAASRKADMLWHTLGPGVHWFNFLVLGAGMFAAQLFMFMFMLWIMLQAKFSPGFFREFCAIAVTLNVTMLPMMILPRIATRLRATQAEQKLVRLTSLIPQNAALNQLFLGQLVRQTVFAMLISLAALLPFMWLLPRYSLSTDYLILEAAIIVCTSALYMHFLRNQVNAKRFDWTRGVSMILMGFLLIGGIAGIAYLNTSYILQWQYINGLLASFSVGLLAFTVFRLTRAASGDPVLWPIISASQ